MNKQKYQSGFAHLAIIIVLIVALLGTLGFVYYQNFVAKKDDQTTKTATSSSNKDTSAKIVATNYKTYTDSEFNASFQYPEKWTVGSVNIPLADDPHWNRGVEVKNESGEIVAELILGVSGLGGTCADENGNPVLSNFTVLDSSPSTIKAKMPISMFYIVSGADDRHNEVGYQATYGLSDTYITNKDYQVCMFYNLFDSNIDNGQGSNYLISFGNDISNYYGKYFKSLDDAKKYIQSDEYKEIKKMLLSFNLN